MIMLKRTRIGWVAGSFVEGFRTPPSVRADEKVEDLFSAALAAEKRGDHPVAEGLLSKAIAWEAVRRQVA
ncbi:hypothetical protein KKC00_00175 [Patescibacteria group bacterium]|nr:hypothetical protein [Patescibacteria group bacterium]